MKVQAKHGKVTQIMHGASRNYRYALDVSLWSIRTTPNRSTCYTPFFLVYGAEVVLPSDICHDSPRVAAYVETDNEKARQESLDILDEERELAAAKSAIYQQDLRRYHNRRIK